MIQSNLANSNLRRRAWKFELVRVMICFLLRNRKIYLKNSPKNSQKGWKNLQNWINTVKNFNKASKIKRQFSPRTGFEPTTPRMRCPLKYPMTRNIFDFRFRGFIKFFNKFYQIQQIFSALSTLTKFFNRFFIKRKIEWVKRPKQRWQTGGNRNWVKTGKPGIFGNFG